MVEANLKIIEELKSFLEIVSSEPDIRKLVTPSETDFSRKRKLTLKRIANFVINMPKRSLSIELQEFFDSMGEEGGACTKSAFSLQRSKLKPLFFQVWNEFLVDSFYRFYGDKSKRWKGFRLQAVDGSTAYLINNEEVREYFGTHDNQHVKVPMARIVQVQDVLNDISVWGNIFPINESERGFMAGNVGRLHEDSLTLFDRGFPSYALMYLMNNQEAPRHFVMRCKVGFNKEVKKFSQGRESNGVVNLKPTKKAKDALLKHGYAVWDSTNVKVRMAKVKLNSGQTEVLLTNLYDEEKFTTEDLKYLYGLRWGVETTFGKQKNQMQMEQFSGHRVICILQDYAGGLITANLQSLIEKQSEDHIKQVNNRRKHDYKINKNISWAWLKHDVIKLFLYNEPEMTLLKLQKYFERNLEPVRPGRKYTRMRKAKRINGKYQTLTNYKRAI